MSAFLVLTLVTMRILRLILLFKFSQNPILRYENKKILSSIVRSIQYLFECLRIDNILID